MEKLESAMSHLRDVSKRLNEATDRGNEVVRRVEAFLNDECSVGIPAWVVLQTRDLGPCHEVTALCYVKVGGRFRIAIEIGRDDEPEESDVRAWAECSRQEKIESLKKLPELIEAIAAAAAKKAEEADAAVAVANRIIHGQAAQKEG